jgi:hypothetical protein
MSRTPPPDVLRALRQEVGFGCPVNGCGNPYLYWHHFDPPWAEGELHDPDGMIALCSGHHAAADSGAYTNDQLRAFKRDVDQAQVISGRFEWMRQSLLAVVGGNFYFETPNPVVVKNTPVVSFGTDDSGHWLLNVNMLTTSGEPRLQIAENFWLSRGAPEEVVCPPSGKALAVKYANGDKIKVKFVKDLDAAALAKRYPMAKSERWGLPSPIAAVEIEMVVAGTGIEFGPRSTKIGGLSMVDCFASQCWGGVVIG